MDEEVFVVVVVVALLGGCIFGWFVGVTMTVNQVYLAASDGVIEFTQTGERFVRVAAEPEEIGKWYFPLEPGIDWYCYESIVDTSKSIEGCFLDGDCPGNKVHYCKVVLAECPYGYDEGEECFGAIYRYYPVCFDEESCENYIFEEVFRIYREVNAK